MQKLIIKNKYQSPNRMNILTAAGIAQINEPILPQNGERIWGGLGVVTFNQASQYNEEENPNDPITPPDCPNCGGGIPPEVPPEEPTVVKECLSDCSAFDNDFFQTQIFSIIDGAISSMYVNVYNFKHYNEAFDAMLNLVQTDEYRAAMDNTINLLVNQNTFDNDTASCEISNINSYRSRLGYLYYKECYDILEYSDGNSESILSGYDYSPSTPKNVYSIYSAILTRKYTDKASGRVTTREIETKAARIVFWGDSNMRCNPCYTRTSVC